MDPREGRSVKTKVVPSKETEPFATVRKDVARAFRPNEVVVLLAISGHAYGDKTSASPAVKTIAKITKISRPTVERSIRRLCTWLWLYCPECGESYLTYKDDKLPHPKPKDARSEYERVFELKKGLSRKPVLCRGDKHEGDDRPVMELRGPAMKRSARTGTSNIYTVFREEPT